MNDSATCYTFEGALETAIAMEEEGFRNYLRALRAVQNKGAKEILRENALDELNHKHQLEKALIEGEMSGSSVMPGEIHNMNLGYALKKQDLGPDSGVREALAYAIQLEKNAVDFYGRVATGCAGAPMADLFIQLKNEESIHLQRLEDMYEQHFMTEN
jgi:rubrerythrin